MSRDVVLATFEDAPTLTRLQIAFDTEFDSPTPAYDALLERYRTVLADQDGFAIIARHGDEPTGFALVTLRPTISCDGPLAVLDELYVCPPLRDQGIGTSILNRVLAEIRERSGGEVHINVDEVDTDTRRFYERHGFVNIEPGTDYRMLCYIQEL